MELKELRYFRVIAEFGTFSKAAAHLRVAQPALSRQIQKLEHKLGVELLRRTSRGVSLTEAGEVLLQRTLHLEHELEVTRREVSKLAREVTGHLRIAVGAPFSVLMIPEILKRYRRICPDVSLHIIDGYSSDLINNLLEDRIDLALCQTPSHTHPDLSVLPLMVETLDLVGPASAATTPLFRSRLATIDQLAELPLIMPSQAHGVRRLLDNAFARAHLKFKPHIEADGPLMIFEMVKAGLGYTLMPSAGYYPLVQKGQLAVIKTRPSIFRTSSIITRTAILGDRTVTPFIDLIKASLSQLVDTPRFGGASVYHGEGAEPLGASLHLDDERPDTVVALPPRVA